MAPRRDRNAFSDDYEKGFLRELAGFIPKSVDEEEGEEDDSLAARCRRDLATFVKEGWHVLEPLTPVEWNWHMDAICFHIQEVLLDWYRSVKDPSFVQRIQNLAINVPPGSAKSRLISVYATAWVWTWCPSWQVICLSSNPGVALRDSEYSREVVQSDWYQDTFQPTWSISEDSNAKGLWKNTAGGLRQSKGFLAKITGDRVDCLTGATLIETECGPVEIRSLIRQSGRKVLCYDHQTEKAVFRRIVAGRRVRSSGLVEITTQSGRRIRCTSDHRVFVSGLGYVSAGQLREGDPLVAGGPDRDGVRSLRGKVSEGRVGGGEEGPERRGWPLLQQEMRCETHSRDWIASRSASMPDMRRQEINQRSTGLSGVLYEASLGDHDPYLLPVRGDNHSTALRDQQEQEKRPAEILLQRDLREGAHGPEHSRCGYMEVPVLRRVQVRVPRAVVLQRSLSESRQGKDRARANVAGQGLRILCGGVPTSEFAQEILRPDLRRRGAFAENAGGGKQQLQDRNQLRQVVCGDAAVGAATRWAQVHGVLEPRNQVQSRVDGSGRNAFEPSYPPHRRGSEKQQPGKPHFPLQSMPQEAPSVREDPVAVVRHLRGRREYVYDLQVEGCRNFFANGVLVHNCILIDDPNDVQEVESDVQRTAVNNRWDLAVANRLKDLRRAVRIGIQQRCHEEDWTGHVEKEGVWDKLVIPEEFDPDDRFVTKLGWTDPRTERGELFFPQRFPPIVLAAEKVRLGTVGYAQQHNQKTVPKGGNLFKESYFRRYRVEGDLVTLYGADGTEKHVYLSDCTVFGTLDPAATEKTANDWVVVAAWAETPARDLLLLEVQRDRQEGPGVKRMVRSLFQKWNLVYMRADQTGLGLPIVQDLRDVEGYPIIGVPLTKDPYARAQGAAIRYERGQIYHPQAGPETISWLPAYEQELLVFPFGVHDDQVQQPVLATMGMRGGSEQRVFADFAMGQHVSPDRFDTFAKNRPMVVGWCFDPVFTAVLTQVAEAEFDEPVPWLIYESWEGKSTEGLEQFVRRVQNALQVDFRGATFLHAAPAPNAGAKGGKDQTRYPDAWMTFATCGQQVTGYHPLQGVAFEERSDAPEWALAPCMLDELQRAELLRGRLTRFYRGTPSLLVDRGALLVIEALSGGYTWLPLAGAAGFSTESTVKNRYSSVVTALGCAASLLFAAGGDGEGADGIRGTASGVGGRTRMR